VIRPYEDLKLEGVKAEMTEAQKLEVMKRNLIKILENDINR